MESIERNKKITDKFADNAEKLLNEWQKMPDSHISDEDSDEQFKAKRKNKFRVNYFHKLGEFITALIASLPTEKESLSTELGSIFQEVRQYREETGLVSEQLIDKMDFFARKVIEKYRNTGE